MLGLTVLGVGLLLQLVAWVGGGILTLLLARFVYRFITAPPKPTIALAPTVPAAAPEATPASAPANAVAAVPATSNPTSSVSAGVSATPNARRSLFDLSRYPDDARWGATAGVISVVVSALKTVFLATGLQGDLSSDGFDAMAMLLALLVTSAPLVWLSWSMLRKPRAWKAWTLLVLISLSLLDGAYRIFFRHDKATMLEFFPETVAFWFALQAIRARRAVMAQAQGRESQPVTDPTQIWRSDFARATWGGILLLAFVGDLVNHHQPVEAAPPIDPQVASTPVTNKTATAAQATPTLTQQATSPAPGPDDQSDIIPAPDSSMPPAALVRSWGENEENCRGSDTPDAPETLAACTVRDNAAEQLNKLGWCHGLPSDSYAESKWRRCAPTQAPPG
jgi:hypothetical protein